MLPLTCLLGIAEVAACVCEVVLPMLMATFGAETKTVDVHDFCVWLMLYCAGINTALQNFGK